MKEKNLSSREKQDRINTNNCDQLSTVVEGLFADAIAKVKAEAEEKARAYTDTISRIKAEATEAIARVKADAEEKARTYTDTIARIKAKAEEKARAYTGTAGTGKPSATVEALFSDAVARQKAKSEAKAAEAIARLKAEAEAKAKVYTDTIARVKAEAEEAIAEQKAKSEAEVGEKVSAYTGTIGKVKAEAKEATAKVKAQVGAITRVKAEADEAIAKVMAEAKEVIAKVKAEVEAKARVYTDTMAELEVEEEAAMMGESKERPIFESIQRAPALREPMAQSPAVVPGEYTCKTPELCTKNIMQKELVWGSPDDSVRQTFAKMQQHGTGYVMVGRNGVLEGIVSRADLTGSISPYLRPVFAKWRRPLDDATLQIRIKWIMSKPVHVISPQMPLGAIMRNMCRFRVRALPVADQQGKVLGLVTEANIFKAILKSKSVPVISASEKGHQVQSASGQAPERTRTQTTKTNQPSLVPA